MMSNDVTSNVTPYEFNADQSKLIGGLGRSMRIVGLVGLAWAVVGIISMGVLAWKSGVLYFDRNPVLALFIGLWTLSGGSSFISGCNSHPATGSLQPVAIGAMVEVTKPSAPSRQTGRMATRRADRP